MTVSDAGVFMVLALVVLLGVALIALARWARAGSAVLSSRPALDQADFDRVLFAGEFRRASQILFLGALPQPMVYAGRFLAIGIVVIVLLALFGLGLLLMLR